MSKLSFRAKALDAAKPMPVYQADDLPDLSECASINRAVPQMPTGMEKEEEMVRRSNPIWPPATLLSIIVDRGRLSRSANRIGWSAAYHSIYRPVLISPIGPLVILESLY